MTKYFLMSNHRDIYLKTLQDFWKKIHW